MHFLNALLDVDADFTVVDVIREYIGFVGSFFIVGAAAFYFLLLRPALAGNSAAITAAARTAARIGILGAVLRLLAILLDATGTMSEKHITFFQAVSARPQMLVTNIAVIIVLLAFAGAAFASRDAMGAWVIAGLGTLVVMLGGLATTQLSRMVNPIHVFAASMWIGTLFVLIAAGVSMALGNSVPAGERGPVVARMVNRFSTIAIVSVCFLVLSGVTTAWKHLGSIAALWTSIYGKTLIVKLCLVACVLALGAYNNRRMKPALGTEQSVHDLKRSSTFEISIAAVVLIVTAVLVSLPAPAEQLMHH